MVGLDWAGSGLDWAGSIWLGCAGSGLELVARLFELIPIATIGTFWDALWLEL